MSYTLGGSTIRPPKSIDEANQTQYAQQKTLSGAVGRDYFGSNKRIWVLKFENCTKTDFDTINTVYQSYLTTGTTQSWVVDETNYTVSSTSVHIDLNRRSFTMPGTDYISDFDLILTEA
jgi:hypothetical protein